MGGGKGIRRHPAATGKERRQERRKADILIELSPDELFHTSDGTGYADIHIDGHRETWPICSRVFRQWLARRYFEAERRVPNSEAFKSAIDIIEAKAKFASPERGVFVRVAQYCGRIYLDLCDKAWRVVEIDERGWCVRSEPPDRFRRTRSMTALPIPVEGGSIAELRTFLNVKSDDDFVPIVAWALAVLRNRGPYPVLVLTGEQGSAKSTFAAILKSLLDPNAAPLRALPREDRDLFIAANNSHLLAFDNVSNIPNWMSGHVLSACNWRRFRGEKALHGPG